MFRPARKNNTVEVGSVRLRSYLLTARLALSLRFNCTEALRLRYGKI
jgi:hypothetical protein